MHSLAIALAKKGYRVSGSDDAIFNPSKSHLEQMGLLPESPGWFPEKIKTDLDCVILGMHAKKDNPELLKAQELGVKIQSYPEFLYELSIDKTRVVVAGSHGKTTITAMVLHVLHYHDNPTDFMLGASVPGISETIQLTDENDFILLEGDEYLSSPIDLKPKILWYRPQIALISGIAWDHVNVFSTEAEYVKQFTLFIETIAEGGVLLYNADDARLAELVAASSHPIKKIPYALPEYEIHNGVTTLTTEEGPIPLSVFGQHNLSNLSGAHWLCQLMGIDLTDFHEAIPSFQGASRRLEKIASGKTSFLFCDFAHAPSKVKATCRAVCEQFVSQKIIACFELHTYSSFDMEFMKTYRDTLSGIDEAIVFYDPEALKIKKRTAPSEDDVRRAFNNNAIKVVTHPTEFQQLLMEKTYENTVLLLMSSGNYGGLAWGLLSERINAF